MITLFGNYENVLRIKDSYFKTAKTFAKLLETNISSEKCFSIVKMTGGEIYEAKDGFIVNHDEYKFIFSKDENSVTVEAPVPTLFTGAGFTVAKPKLEVILRKNRCSYFDWGTERIVIEFSTEERNVYLVEKYTGIVIKKYPADYEISEDIIPLLKKYDSSLTYLKISSELRFFKGNKALKKRFDNRDWKDVEVTLEELNDFLQYEITGEKTIKITKC